MAVYRRLGEAVKRLGKGISDLPEELLRKQVLVFTGSLIVSAFLFLRSIYSSDIQEGNRLLRAEPGGRGTEYHVQVEGIDDKGLPLSIRVSPRRYSIAEAEELFEALTEDIEYRISSADEALDAVSTRLYLPDGFPEYGIAAEWEYQVEAQGDTEEERLDYIKRYRNLIDRDGSVHNEGFSENEEVEGYLRLRLHCPVAEQEKEPYYSCIYSLFVRVVPREYTMAEKLMRALERELGNIDIKSIGESSMMLPKEILGKPLHFSMPRDYSYIYIPPLGLCLAIALYFRRKEQEQELRRIRERQLMADYTELLYKLSLYIGAGLTIRNAFKAISTNYDERIKGRENEDRYLYQELRYMRRQLDENASETEVYRGFGLRIGLRPYTKLVSLLEQNRKNGSRELIKLMALEMSDAFELRKNTARRLGEESSTKLLLPLLLQLSIVLLIIVVPAMLSFYS